MKSGTYWIGDLCYVMHSEWCEVCDISFDRSGNSIEGELTLKNGVEFAIFSTAHGDGEYYDNDGNSYSVDSGTLGCILLSDIDQSNVHNNILSGNIVTFKTDFIAASQYDVCRFGSVSIDTANEFHECGEEE